MPKKIVLRFKNREAKVEAFGFSGQSCAKGTEFLKKTLGECKDFERKGEWYEENLGTDGIFNSNICG